MINGKMTKLQEWVFALTLYAIFYFLALKNALPFDVSESTKFAIQLVSMLQVHPIITVVM